MNILNRIRQLKFKYIRYIESSPKISNLVYNNIHRFKFLFPHEKDYHGIRFFIPPDSKGDFIDIGANIGLSTIGFRQLGYQNPIKLFEANPFLSRFLDDLEKKYENLEINQIALGNENTELDLYLVYYKNRCLHTFSSFSKEFVQQSLAKCYPQKLAMFEIRSQKVPMIRFDDMAEQWNPVFIKIDVEGFEYPILQGMERTIHRCRPVFLIEFNPTQFKLITDFLPKDYALYSYNHTEEKIELIDPENIHERIREGGGMSIRNIYFSAHQ